MKQTARKGSYMNVEIAQRLAEMRRAKGYSQEELAEKTKRLKELNILLNMDQKDKTLIDSAPDEGEEPPARKVVGLER